MPILQMPKPSQILSCLHFLWVGLILASLGCMRVPREAIQIRSLEPRELAETQQGSASTKVLDIRDEASYEEGHIPGAIHVPAHQVEGYLSRVGLPSHTKLILVCEHGKLSQLTAASAAAWHRGEVFDLAGGASNWSDAQLALEKGAGSPLDASLLDAPQRPLSPSLQFVSFLSGCIIKPAYMLLCLVLIAWLWKATTKPLRMIFWGLVSFEVGEIFCALDYYLGQGEFWRPLDLVHGAGMVGMGILVPWAAFKILDERVFHYTDPVQPCALHRFCGACGKRQGNPCGMHRLFLAALPAFAFMSLMPLSMPLRPMHSISSVFGTPVPFGSPLVNQAIEFWGYGLAGALAFFIAFGILCKGSRAIRYAEPFYFLGLGLAGFAIFRFLLHGAFAQALVWSDFWEEATELIALVGLAYGLWIFRKNLGLSRPHDTNI